MVWSDEIFEVRSEYMSAALKMTLSLEGWWKQSPANHQNLSSFAHILVVGLKVCFPCRHSTMQLKKERMQGLVIDSE